MVANARGNSHDRLSHGYHVRSASKMLNVLERFYFWLEVVNENYDSRKEFNLVRKIETILIFGYYTVLLGWQLTDCGFYH